MTASPVRPALYHGVRHPARMILRALTSLDVEGVEHIPREGPFLLLPNHQSIVDPVLVQSVCPREVHSMTKSTQFASPLVSWFLVRVGAFPARRYQVDPQSVRMVLRLLESGEGVCVYPEGERSWDGRLQPFRMGTLRLILRSGVPVVPVGIHGTFEFWPRWLSVPQPGAPTGVRFGRPLHFGAVLDRDERERRLPEVERILCEEIQRLSGVEFSDRLQDRLQDDRGATQSDSTGHFR